MDIYEKTIVSMKKWIHLYCCTAHEYEIALVEIYSFKTQTTSHQTGRENTHIKNIVYITCVLTNLFAMWFIS